MLCSVRVFADFSLCLLIIDFVYLIDFSFVISYYYFVSIMFPSLCVLCGVGIDKLTFLDG